MTTTSFQDLDFFFFFCFKVLLILNYIF